MYLINETLLRAFVEQFRRYTRERLVVEGYLLPPLPPKGARLLTRDDRSEMGNCLLREAKAVLVALLFGGEATGVDLVRVERELLTLTVPRSKRAALSFLQSATDSRAGDVMVDVEYGEVDGESVGEGIVTALRLINLLEVNEQVLPARIRCRAGAHRVAVSSSGGASTAIDPGIGE